MSQGDRCHISAKCDGHGDPRNTPGLVTQNPPFQVVDEPQPVTALHVECLPIREERGELELKGQARPRRSVPAKFANVPIRAVPREDAPSQPVLDLVCFAVLNCLLHLDDGGTAIQQRLEQGFCCVRDLGLAGV